MTIREIITARAREAAVKIAKGYIHRDDHYPPRYNVDEIANDIAEELKHGFAAILTDPQIGFKEALEWIHNRPCGSCDAFPPCEGLPNGMCNGEPVDSCTCPCHSAESKLSELRELSK